MSEKQIQNQSDEVAENEVRRKSVSWLALGVFIVGVLALLVWTRPERQARVSPEVAADSSISRATSVQERLPSEEEPEPAGQPALQKALPESYSLKTRFGKLGPQLLDAGAIDPERFVQLYEQNGRPLTVAQQAILFSNSDETIVINSQNAHFLLNFFWALGLTNDNPILTEGPMMEASEGNIGRFASTGGWTLGRLPATELYASMQIITLTTEQQERLEEVASNVYRPCCNNHTAFADCNHGMAMLGLLELLAGRDASIKQMYTMAQNVNAFWFPQQAVESAFFFKMAMNLDYADVDPRIAVGPEVFSGSGSQLVRAWLAENGALEQAPGSGDSCGV